MEPPKLAKYGLHSTISTYVAVPNYAARHPFPPPHPTPTPGSHSPLRLHPDRRYQQVPGIPGDLRGAKPSPPSRARSRPTAPCGDNILSLCCRRRALFADPANLCVAPASVASGGGRGAIVRSERVGIGGVCGGCCRCCYCCWVRRLELGQSQAKGCVLGLQTGQLLLLCVL